jgi:hypothetical protein
VAWIWSVVNWIGLVLAAGAGVAIFFNMTQYGSPGASVFYEFMEYSLGALALGVGLMFVSRKFQT